MPVTLTNPICYLLPQDARRARADLIYHLTGFGETWVVGSLIGEDVEAALKATTSPVHVVGSLSGSDGSCAIVRDYAGFWCWAGPLDISDDSEGFAIAFHDTELGQFLAGVVNDQTATVEEPVDPSSSSSSTATPDTAGPSEDEGPNPSGSPSEPTDGGSPTPDDSSSSTDEPEEAAPEPADTQAAVSPVG